MFLNAQNPIFFSGGFAPRTPYKKYLLGFFTLASVLIGSTDVSPWGTQTRIILLRTKILKQHIRREDVEWYQNVVLVHIVAYMRRTAI